MYNALLEAILALSIPFAEFEWSTRPAGDYGTIQIDLDAAEDPGDDGTQDRAVQGSADLFLHSFDRTAMAAVEAVLEAHCGAAWHRNSVRYEQETGLLHVEYVFELEAF